jgi:hypothetical protein
VYFTRTGILVSFVKIKHLFGNGMTTGLSFYELLAQNG